jgi:hypothetical protein
MRERLRHVAIAETTNGDHHQAEQRAENNVRVIDEDSLNSVRPT